MCRGKITGTSKDEIFFESIGELDSILDQLNKEFAQKRPSLVEIEIKSGDILSIGLGLNKSLLSFVSASGDPPYFISKGKKENLEDTVVFYCHNEWSEFPSFALIQMELARTVVREFVKTGKLSDKIEWEEG